MAHGDLTWPDAITRVLEESDQPLHYQRITELIGVRGLRALSGATPSATVRASLLSLIDPKNTSYDKRIRRVARGTYEFASADQDELQDVQAKQDIEEERESGDPIGVPAFGLYWKKDKVRWRKPGEILGRQTRDSDTVNFADQQGVYLLHKDRTVVYVGRTERSLFDRLRHHTRDRKSPRWDQFSWFGFRDVNDDAELQEPRLEFDLTHLICVLESVLIEALEPPVNGQRGDYMGDLYEQVPNAEIAQLQSREFLQNLVG